MLLRHIGLSDEARTIIELLTPGRWYRSVELAATLGKDINAVGMQLVRMAKRGDLVSRKNKRQNEFALPGTVQIEVRVPTRMPASNWGQILGRRLMEEA